MAQLSTAALAERSLARYAPHLHAARASNDHPEYTLACLALAVCGEVTDGHAVAPLVSMLLHHEPLPLPPADGPDAYLPAEGTVETNVCTLAVGSPIMLRGRPCTVSQIQFSRAGKGGHDKAFVDGDDVIRHGVRHSEVLYRFSRAPAPVVKCVRYLVIDASATGGEGGRGVLSLLDEEDKLREDLPLPPNPTVRAALLDCIAADESLVAVVRSALGEEVVASCEAGP